MMSQEIMTRQGKSNKRLREGSLGINKPNVVGFIRSVRV